MTSPEIIPPADVTTTPTDPASPPATTPTRKKVRRGLPVSFTFTDPVTGRVLDGVGLAVDVPDDGGAVAVLPLQSNYLFVSPEAVQVVELDG